MAHLEVRIEESWRQILQEEFNSSYFHELRDFIKSEYRRTTVYPEFKYLFRAFNSTPFDKIKVVILGQDPYHGDRQANGLCFSVNPGVPIPPSLKNIYIEMKNQLGGEIPDSGDLNYLANQGVLLLNATLTVVGGIPGSHQGRGWEIFTDKVVQILSENKEHLVFILWGNYARKKGEIIDIRKHLVLSSAHPSPLSASRGFFKNGHFIKTNNYLIQNGIQPILWLPTTNSVTNDLE